jgi:hypothetical protein
LGTSEQLLEPAAVVDVLPVTVLPPLVVTMLLLPPGPVPTLLLLVPITELPLLLVVEIPVQSPAVLTVVRKAAQVVLLPAAAVSPAVQLVWLPPVSVAQQAVSSVQPAPPLVAASAVPELVELLQACAAIPRPSAATPPITQAMFTSFIPVCLSMRGSHVPENAVEVKATLPAPSQPYGA